MSARPNFQVCGMASRKRRSPDLPASPLEFQLLRIWQDLLGTDKIGVNQEFAALDGDRTYSDLGNPAV